jgi:hypothetical protein
MTFLPVALNSRAFLAILMVMGSPISCALFESDSMVKV